MLLTKKVSVRTKSLCIHSFNQKAFKLCVCVCVCFGIALESEESLELLKVENYVGVTDKQPFI